MNPEQIYDRCCEATRVLLRGFETRDLSLIERQVRLLRQYLSRRPDTEDFRFSGQTLLRMEQLDALDGITEQMERSLAAIRQSAQAEFERMLSTQGIFRHLTAGSSEPERSPLLVC
jgi:hypothetical protein